MSDSNSISNVKNDNENNSINSNNNKNMKINSEEIENELTCSICFENIENNKNMILTECKHKFHFSCIIKYLKNAIKRDDELKCPICRDNFEKHEVKETEVEIEIEREMEIEIERETQFNTIRMNLTTGQWENNNSRYFNDLSIFNDNNSSSSEEEDELLDEYLHDLYSEIH
jgi:hypothetical protein